MRKHLRRLLGRAGTTHVAVDVGGIAELASVVLDVVPDAAGGGGSALGTDKRVDASRELAERGLDVAALGVAGADKGRVDGEQDPRAALEQEGGEDDAEPEEDLEARHNRHGRVVVLLDKGANAVSQGAGRLGAGRRAVGGTGRRRADGGQQVGAGVRGDVEDGVDAVREEGERVLGGKEPDQGHHYNGLALDEASGIAGNARRTEVLDILIREETNGTAGHLGASLCAGLLRLEDDNAVGQSGGDERGAVRENGHAAVVVHAQPGEAISDRGQDEGQVPVGSVWLAVAHVTTTGCRVGSVVVLHGWVLQGRSSIEMRPTPGGEASGGTYPANQATGGYC